MLVDDDDVPIAVDQRERLRDPCVEGARAQAGSAGQDEERISRPVPAEGWNPCNEQVQAGTPGSHAVLRYVEPAALRGKGSQPQRMFEPAGRQ